MTDARRLPDPLPAIRALCPGTVVVLRHYDDPNRAELARCVAAICRSLRLRLLIGADARLAAQVRAQGVHLPEGQIRLACGIKRARPGWLVTAAAHGRAALTRAARAGCDAVLLAPVFATASHPGGTPLGPVRFAGLVRASSIPVVALGGIGRGIERRLGGTGACGIAGIGRFSPRGGND